MKLRSVILPLAGLGCVPVLSLAFFFDGATVAAFALQATLSVALAWLLSQRNHQREQLRERMGELEAMLALQEQRVEHLTLFAEQMQESEAGTRAIIDNALDGVITIDHTGRVIGFNPAAEKIFGFQREQLLGQPLEEWIVPHSLREQHRRGMAQFLATGQGALLGQRVETIGLHADGREFPLELSISVLHAQRPPMLTAYVRDLSQLKQTAEMLAQSNARLQATLDAATQAAIIATDSAGTITLFNRGAERMLGYEANEVIGEHTPELIHSAEEVAAHGRHLTAEFGVPIEGFAALSERARRGDHEEREWTYLRKDGSSLTVNLAFTAIRDDNDGIRGYLGVATDVTGRRRAALTLERAKQAAEAANQAKSDFLANMSHEIRTPMNGILGMTQLALDTDLTGDQREYLRMVKTSADGLLTVINDILDFSKIEAGKLELDPLAFELRDTLADSLRSLSLRANAKNIELACHVPAEVPDFLVGDPGRLRQVLLNLVGNAIKFTERGEVVVRVQLVSEDGQNAEDTNPPSTLLQPGGDITLHFAVSDTGIGIAADKLPYIFDPFVQADSSTTRKYGGTGLGLTITGRLVEMMGGRLWAESVPEQGSTFHFTIRIKLQDRSPSRLLPRRPHDLAGLSVLVVDDNATNCRILADLLGSWLMKPTTVDGVQLALVELEAAAGASQPFPLVLLDAHMPGEDGFALAAEIRARPHLGEPGLLMLSSADRGGDGEKCRALKIGQRLTKPIKPSDLLVAILRLLDLEANTSHPISAPLVAQTPSAGTLVEVGNEMVATTRSLRVLLAEDNFVNQRLVLAVLEKQGHRVVAVPNGAAALRAVQQESFDVVLMDVQMPEMNGLEATRAIRIWEQQGGGHVPIVAMTAHAMKGAREDCLQAGMDEYLSKPIQVPALARVMEELTRGRQERSVARPVVFDPRPLLQRISEDRELFHELIDMFQADCPRLLRQVREAIEASDAAALERASHLLKGSASNFAATEVMRITQRLESLGRDGDLREAGDIYRSLEEALSHFRAAVEEWLAVHSVQESVAKAASGFHNKLC
ncbi:MAG TPA: PAS domain S-box protein [Gemmataceae bacterium]|nr:PAS domain S-box protein [Gemmataceae bacterium]